MSIERRLLGHGPQAPATPPQRTESGRRIRAAEADIDSTPLYRPGGLEYLDQLRDSGVLGTTSRPPHRKDNSAERSS
ncbi:hypothetical protein [Streptomyces sp. NPDC058701]|uniref:hypothetical protein n=1 Tax=Streptomyces sp. NPDC058701 TaxID=3346608 RepID=UPI00365ED064